MLLCLIHSAIYRKCSVWLDVTHYSHFSNRCIKHVYVRHHRRILRTLLYAKQRTPQLHHKRNKLLMGNYIDIFHKKLLETKAIVTIAILVLINIVVYHHTLGNQFIDKWDDQWQIINAYTISDWNWQYISHLFRYSFHGQYSPLNQLLYCTIYQICGLNPSAFHCVSLAIHILNTILIYKIISHILFKKSKYDNQKCNNIAFITSLLFAVHPLQVESVAWMSASKILLSSFFYILACYFFVFYIEARKTLHYIGSIICFLLAYLSKEQAVTLPLMLTVLTLIYKGWKIDRTFFLQITPFFILALLMGCFFVFETKNNSINTLTSSATYTWWQRIIFASYALTEYICKAIIPYNLRFKYYYPLSPTELTPLWLFFYPLLITTIIYSFRNIFKKPIIVIGTAIFLIHLILVLHIIPIDRQHIIADRYMYLSIIGIALPFAYYGITFYHQLKSKKFKYALISLFLLAITSFSIESFERTQKWNNSNTIYNDIFIPNESLKPKL